MLLQAHHNAPGVDANKSFHANSSRADTNLRNVLTQCHGFKILPFLKICSLLCFGFFHTLAHRVNRLVMRIKQSNRAYWISINTWKWGQVPMPVYDRGMNTVSATGSSAVGSALSIGRGQCECRTSTAMCSLLLPGWYTCGSVSALLLSVT